MRVFRNFLRVLRSLSHLQDFNKKVLFYDHPFLFRAARNLASSNKVAQVHNVESRWLNLLFKMAEHTPNTSEVLPWPSGITQIREMLSKAARMRRTESSGDVMPNAVAKEVRHFYSSLKTKEEKLAFFLVLERDLGVDHEEIASVASNLVNAQKNGVAAMLRAEENLRQALEPAHIQLFSQISKLQGGVKNIVDMRSDLLEGLNDEKDPVARQELQALNSSVKNLLAQWFAVGLLALRRITWESPASILEKIIHYEAVHSIHGWGDLKRRLAPDRRCYVYTHRSMPGEPVVVLHTALEYEIADNIQAILSEPEVDGDEYVYELEKRTTAVFYSITSTQKGLSGVDLGNFLIKHVVQELQHEFPNIEQYSTLSPIPGFRQWLKTQINNALQQEEKGVSQMLLSVSEGQRILEILQSRDKSPLALFKELLETADWYQNSLKADCLKQPLLRLCACYLYREKKRGFVMDAVGNFHIRNGACMWRLNWLADLSPRGMDNSYGIMVNYKYVLEDVDKNNQQYLLNGTVTASSEFLELL
ncbi:malonyl-CoA decarboxylase, mitochondrial-like isoform X1 [Montipora capricornis]|uniref:malonyl-CoA decarboxylase, mitochondrial-like isoform X1 n=2 Tax=Montipora capricornis TaxID=246305 RepID=UPI0035F152D5